MTETTDMGIEIDRLTRELAETLAAMSESSFIREGLLKHAVTSFVWDLFDKFPGERDGLIDALENWPDLIRDAVTKEASAQS